MPAASGTSAGGPTMPKPSQAAVDRFRRAERSMGGYDYYEYDGGSQSAADTKPGMKTRTTSAPSADKSG